MAHGKPNPLENYDVRLRSFQTYPPSYPISKEVLAAAGFVYEGKKDNVVCPFCLVRLYQWQKGYDPVCEHRKYSKSRCRFLEEVLPFTGGKGNGAVKELVQEPTPRFSVEQSSEDYEEERPRRQQATLHKHTYTHDRTPAVESQTRDQTGSHQEDRQHMSLEGNSLTPTPQGNSLADRINAIMDRPHVKSALGLGAPREAVEKVVRKELEEEGRCVIDSAADLLVATGVAVSPWF